MNNIEQTERNLNRISPVKRTQNRVQQFLAAHSPAWDLELRRFLLQRIISEDHGKRYRLRVCQMARRKEIDNIICEAARELLEQLGGDSDRTSGGAA